MNLVYSNCSSSKIFLNLVNSPLPPDDSSNLAKNSSREGTGRLGDNTFGGEFSKLFVVEFCTNGNICGEMVKKVALHLKLRP